MRTDSTVSERAAVAVVTLDTNIVGETAFNYVKIHGRGHTCSHSLATNAPPMRCAILIDVAKS
jgi:hypothetical protein